MQGQPLKALQVIGVCYRESRLARGNERALDAYVAAGAYQQAQVPFKIVEPAMPEARRQKEESDNLGMLGGMPVAVCAGLALGRGTSMDCRLFLWRGSVCWKGSGSFLGQGL